MKNYWLLRAKPHNVDRIEEFLTQNIVAVGWPGIPDLSQLNKDILKEKLHEQYPNASNRDISLDANILNRFSNEMKIDDIIVTPTEKDVYFFKITSNYFYEISKATENEGYPHQRNVELLKSVSRYQLIESLKKPLRTRYALADINNYSDEIDNLLTGNSTNYLSNDNFLSFKYPLRENLSIDISIPKDITMEESERLGNFIKKIYDL